MAYANTTTKRDQVLTQLASNLNAIAPSAYKYDVKRVVVYEAQKAVLGGETPAIMIAPVADSKGRSLACAQDEYTMGVQMIGVLRVDSSTNAWKSKIQLLAGDIQQAVANDRQLSGKAVYVEIDEVDIADASTLGNRTLCACVVTATIVYRVGVSDITT